MEAARGDRLAKVGLGMSILVSLLFLMSAVMKFVGGPALAEGMAHLQLPLSLAVPLGILETACVVVYLIPATAVTGAILMTGYIGGAILTHLRVGDSFLIHIVLGLVVWGGLYLRERRLKALIPLRRPSAAAVRRAA